MKPYEIAFVPSLFSHNIYSQVENQKSFSLIVPLSYFQLFQIDYSKFYYDLLTNIEVKKIIDVAFKIKGDGSLNDKSYFAIMMSMIMNNYKIIDITENKDTSLTTDIIVYIENHYRENLELDHY